MSDETRNFFNHDPFISSTNNYSFSFSNTNHDHDQLGFDPQYMMSFTNFDGYDQGMQRDEFVQSNNSEMFSMVKKDHSLDQVATPNSSMSSSSNEAGGDEDKSKKNCQPRRVSDHDLDNMGDSSKKVESKEKTGIKKKAEKKERQTRFAFMTKSEVDHLEDGYRWRKYGQKAVKNSPFPRSYYRCTTQKCTVKKRVERCYEDPSTVVTTYEGQHNHPIPSNMRGSGTTVSNHLFSSQSIPMNDMITNHMPPIGTSSICFPAGHHDQNNIVHDQHYNHDYGLLQDMLPSMFFLKHEQHHQ